VRVGLWPWVTLALLGAYHGVNPGMGWLFAVSRGLQERSRRAVTGSLLPIAVGHELAVAVAVVVLGGAALAVPATVLRVGGAAVLIGFGLWKLARPNRHPRWVGMRVNRRQLTLWSFLMSSAHGAGLMLVPVVLGMSSVEASAGGGGRGGGAGSDLASLGAGSSWLRDGVAVAVHTAAMLVVMAAVAVLVYEKVGVGVLRKAWVNLDLVWAGALVAAGVFTLFT
jgi:hypothetical protein